MNKERIREPEAALTRISKNNKNKIKNTEMTPQEILDFLESGAIYRTFKDVLAKVYPGDDINRVLTDRLTEMTGGVHDTVARNVRNWMKGSNVPQREQLFQICFALKMDEAQANQVLASASDMGIHYRNPEELIYAYCLRKGKTWKEALELKKEILPEYEKRAEAAKKANAENADAENAKKYTRQIQNDFDNQVANEEELKTFLYSSAEMFGMIHETAYEEFRKMLEMLQNPDKEFKESSYFEYLKRNRNKLNEKELRILQEHEKGLEANSVAEVIDNMLQMHVPQSRGKKKEPERNYTYLQRVIKKNWPSENILYKMRTREVDVTRKVLLLLFLLTEEFEVSDPREAAGGYAPEDEEEEFEYLTMLEEEDSGERMEIRLRQMNLFLDTFGMNRLDPGNPFDCVVLYALKASYTGGEEDDAMSERLERTLNLLFGE